MPPKIMGTVLERIRAAVTRAKQHVQDFQLGLQAFYDTTPYEVRTKDNPQTGGRIYYFAKADPVPYELTTIAADVIQNLRSPLDHIANALVLDARSGTPPDWKVYYPISGSATDYPATRGGRIKGVRQEVIDAIDATEPYKGGKGHALWQLNELNKRGKHIDLIGAVTVEDGVDLRSIFKDVFKDSMPAWYFQSFKSVPPVFVRPIKSPPLNVGDVLHAESLDTKMDKDRRFSFAVTLHAAGIIEREPALKALQDFTNLVDEIIMKLGRLLR